MIRISVCCCCSCFYCYVGCGCDRFRVGVRAHFLNVRLYSILQFGVLFAMAAWTWIFSLCCLQFGFKCFEFIHRSVYERNRIQYMCIIFGIVIAFPRYIYLVWFILSSLHIHRYTLYSIYRNIAEAEKQHTHTDTQWTKEECGRDTTSLFLSFQLYFNVELQKRERAYDANALNTHTKLSLSTLEWFLL